MINRPITISILNHLYFGENINCNWSMQLIDVLIDIGHNLIYVHYTDRKYDKLIGRIF